MEELDGSGTLFGAREVEFDVPAGICWRGGGLDCGTRGGVSTLSVG